MPFSQKLFEVGEVWLSPNCIEYTVLASNGYRCTLMNNKNKVVIEKRINDNEGWKLIERESDDN